MTMRRLSIIASIVAGFASASAAAAELGPLRQAPGAGATTHNCSCLNRGTRVQLGDSTCLRVGDREYTAQCAMTLNNPSWHYVGEGCEPDRISLLLQ
jgi:hypothetical protein